VSAVTTGRIELSSVAPAERKKHVRFAMEAPASPSMDEHLMEELYELCEVRESGTAFILRHSHVKMKLGSSLLKKLAKKPWGHGPGWPTVRSVSWLPVDGRELTQLDMRSAGICIVLQLKKITH
jgi:hypothetical protein